MKPVVSIFFLMGGLIITLNVARAESHSRSRSIPGEAFPKLVRHSDTHHPVQTNIQKILAHPDLFDGDIVRITGYVVSVKHKLSRGRNFYIKVTVSPFGSGVYQKEKTLTVFALSWPRLKEGDGIVVEGVYHMDYRFGGASFENFIDAESIEWVSVL